MQIRQISIFLENKPCQLSQICRVLSDAGVNIMTMSVADTSDFGIVRMVVADTDGAQRALTARGYAVNVTEVVAVCVPDRPGGLADVLTALDGADVNLEYAYAIDDNDVNTALLALRFDDNAKAVQALSKAGFKMLSETEIRRV